MEKLTCLAIDDDPTSLMIISNLARKSDKLELLESYTNPIEAAAGIILLSPDIIFLDIEMPEFTGLEMLESLVKPPKVIMVTSQKDYEKDAFDLEVVDFVLKPVNKTRFDEAVEKALVTTEKNIIV